MQATVDDMRARMDVRALLRLCFDDDDVHVAGELSESAILNAALNDATGALKAAVSVAGIYSESDLERLEPSSAELAKRIVCELAVVFLTSRRGTEKNDSLQTKREFVESYLDKLRKGERLFVVANDSSKQDAGTPELVAPSAIELSNLNGITSRASVYFGPIARKMPRRPYLGE